MTNTEGLGTLFSIWKTKNLLMGKVKIEKIRRNWQFQIFMFLVCVKSQPTANHYCFLNIYIYIDISDLHG